MALVRRRPKASCYDRPKICVQCTVAPERPGGFWLAGTVEFCVPERHVASTGPFLNNPPATVISVVLFQFVEFLLNAYCVIPSIQNYFIILDCVIFQLMLKIILSHSITLNKHLIKI